MDWLTDFRAGDTVKFTVSHSDYKASAGWAAKFRLVGNAGNVGPISASASSDDHKFEVLASTTAAYVAGKYTGVLWVEKGTDRYTLATDTIEILRNLAADTANTDTRSHAVKTLALINSAIESYAVTPTEEITIAGRTVRRPTLADLYRFKQQYEYLVQRELQAEAIANGDTRKKILLEFTATT